MKTEKIVLKKSVLKHFLKERTGISIETYLSGCMFHSDKNTFYTQSNSVFDLDLGAVAWSTMNDDDYLVTLMAESILHKEFIGFFPDRWIFVPFANNENFCKEPPQSIVKLFEHACNAVKAYNSLFHKTKYAEIFEAAVTDRYGNQLTEFLAARIRLPGFTATFPIRYKDKKLSGLYYYNNVVNLDFCVDVSYCTFSNMIKACNSIYSSMADFKFYKKLFSNNTDEKFDRKVLETALEYLL